MKTFIMAETETGQSIDYFFEVNKVDKCSMDGATGEYISTLNNKRMSNIPEINIKKGSNESTIIHEALHATIDFFRVNQKVDFTELFDVSVNFGEEAFCHYHKQFCDAIREALV